MNCCYGCGRPGKFEFKSPQSANYGKLRCSEAYRSCPVQAQRGGNALLGKKLSAQTKEKIGLKSRGRPSVFKGLTALDDSRILAGAKHPAFGKLRDVVVREKISKAQRGKKLTPEHRQKISKSLSGSKNPRFKKGWSDSQKIKWKHTVYTRQSLAGNKNPNWNPDLDRKGLRAYRSAVMRLSNKNARDSGLLPPNIIRSRTPGGMELDHIVPISICFREHVGIDHAASLKNLQLIPWEHNMKKLNKHYPVELLISLKNPNSSL